MYSTASARRPFERSHWTVAHKPCNRHGTPVGDEPVNVRARVQPFADGQPLRAPVADAPSLVL